MPNYKTHAVAGTLSCLGVTFYDYQKRKINDPNTEFDFIQLIINIAAGFAGATFPNKIEPAYNPNHRSTCHSLFMAAINVCGINATSDFEQLNPRLKSAINAFLYGYLSHLALDFTTPKGLPLI